MTTSKAKQLSAKYGMSLEFDRSLRMWALFQNVADAEVDYFTAAVLGGMTESAFILVYLSK